MKVLICLSLLVVGTATCDTLTGVDVQSGAVTQSDVTSPEYSKANQEDYKAYSTPQSTPQTELKYSPAPGKIVTLFTPANNAIPTQGIRSEVYNRPVAVKAAPPVAYKPAPTVRRVVEEVGPTPYKTQIYSAPKSVVQASSPYVVKSSNQNDGSVYYSNDYSDAEDEPVEPDEYPEIQIGPSRVPPVKIFRTYPAVVRRSYRVSAHRKPIAYNIGSFRTLGYERPISYTRTVPTLHHVAYGYPSSSGKLRYVLRSSDIAYDDGISPVDIDVEYDELLKKKK